ncbi:MAG TPA: c-type cytochrome biogenesis protein CcsB [Streptosporangiaceae bacterium]|nr:c-type cytochrome biogenesis protein CcsB [Streptosporangiaceae bacterium]
MPVNTGLAQVSNDFLLAAVIIYALAMLAFACDFAFGKKPVKAVAAARVHAPALVGAAAGSGDVEVTPPVTPPAVTAPAAPAAAAGRSRIGPWVAIAVALVCLGLTLHTTGVVLRGVSVHRLPWGDMYEFVTALTCVAVAFFVVAMIRYRAYYLGLFVMVAVVLVLGLAETVIYTPAGQLPPALQSYWLAIHVTAMTLATGVFFVAAVAGITYLFVDRYARRVAAGRPAGSDGILRRLPGPEALDRLAYRTVVFGFPIWTFGVMAGAIWADRAWGSYWSWDPTETWAFITWVVYACFLHARATAGWRGRRATVIQLLGFGCLIFNVLVISLVVPGLHSYAGLT